MQTYIFRVRNRFGWLVSGNKHDFVQYIFYSIQKHKMFVTNSHKRDVRDGNAVSNAIKFSFSPLSLSLLGFLFLSCLHNVRTERWMYLVYVSASFPFLITFNQLR